MEDSSHFPTHAAAALRFAKPPKFTTDRDAYAFRDALSGRADRTEVAAQGAAFIDGLFIPTALAHLGSTFEWATPAAVSIRVQMVTSAMVQPDPVRA